jgi:hypothetical protein
MRASEYIRRVEDARRAVREADEALKREWRISDRYTLEVYPVTGLGEVSLSSPDNLAVGKMTDAEIEAFIRCRRAVHAWNRDEIEELPMDCP